MSKDQFYLSISITVNATTNNSCASQETIDKKILNILSVNYVNPVINPSNPDFISYYLVSNDYGLSLVVLDLKFGCVFLIIQ